MVTYYHVELETHDILIADGAPAESYLDTGNRRMFENVDAPLILHPDFGNDLARRVARSHLPFVDQPAAIEPLWRLLAARAGHLGMALPDRPETTRDPGLRIEVDGGSIPPVRVADGRAVFVVPPAAGRVRLLSRRMVPADLRPWTADVRDLGVMVRALVWRRGDAVMPVALDDPSLSDGWWAPEWHGDTTLCRWTNGEASLPVPPLGAGALLLEVTMATGPSYPLPRADNTRGRNCSSAVRDRTNWAIAGSRGRQLA